MKTSHALYFIFTLTVSTLSSSNEEIPLEVFAAHSKFKQMILSPDGKHIAFTFEDKNNEVKAGIISSDMKKISAIFGNGKDKHIINHFWANNQRLVMQAVTNTGWLDDSKPAPATMAANIDGKKRKRLFDGGWSFYRLLSSLRKDPRNILVAKYHGYDRGVFKLKKLNVKTGKESHFDEIPRVVGSSRIVAVGLDNKDKLRLAFENNTGDDKYDFSDDILTIHVRDGKDWLPVKLPKSQRKSPLFQGLGFNIENTKYYFLSNFDMASNDKLGVFSFDFTNNQIQLVFRDKEVDLLSAIRGPKGEVLGVRYYPGYPAAYYFDDNNQEVKFLKSVSASFKGQLSRITSYTDDGSKAIIYTSSDKNPGDFFLYDRVKGKVRFLASAQPKVEPEKMASMEAFSMIARDGVKLFGLLTLPNHKKTNLPLIVLPHGGPHGPLDFWGFDREVQLFANRGYAVLQLNFRGSGGYGQDFEESGHRKWGREMQDDLTDATYWAIKEGIADKDRICLYGGSYGGYATLQGLVREPDLYQCGVGIAGVYSLQMMWDGDSDGRKGYAVQYSNVWLDKFIGKNPDELKKYSPAFNVDKIKAAIFIIHGSNDVRVPLSHAELLKEQLDKIGKEYEWLVREEGHGFTQVKNRIEQYNQVLAFFEKHIGK